MGGFGPKFGPYGCQTMRLLTLAPVISWNNGSRQVAIFGESLKIVPVSKQRIRQITVRDDFISFNVLGSPGEEITFFGWNIDGRNMFNKSVTIDDGMMEGVLEFNEADFSSGVRVNF